ncbi:hypothetical protein HDV02_002210 [Globomyces sp. JEL0801]|nr:hypothetical protein HDV02_002210 [Globomyces sp. JEL0801]
MDHFGKVDMFLYNLYCVPNLFNQIDGEESTPLLQREFSYEAITANDTIEPSLRSVDSYSPSSPSVQTQPFHDQSDDSLTEYEQQGIVSQMKDVISKEETWSLVLYYSVYKLPSAIIMFALAAVILTPLLNYFKFIPSSDLFLQFCHWLNISTSIGYLIWCGLSILALPFILIICGQIYIMERRFLKVITHLSNK